MELLQYPLALIGWVIIFRGLVYFHSNYCDQKKKRCAHSCARTSTASGDNATEKLLQALNHDYNQYLHR